MGQALIGYSQSNDVEPDPEKVEEFCTFPGEGICGKIDEKQIYIGTKRWLPGLHVKQVLI